jgi:alkylated DNA repair dioxygenase AlkB
MEPIMTAPVLDVRYLPDALADADALFARLRDIEWDRRMHARRTASFGRPYNYSGQIYDAVPMPAVVVEIAACASVHAGHPFDNCLANLYETGRNTMGFHHDSYDELEPGSLIAIASFGATRALVFRSVDRVHRETFRLAHGSLLLMTEHTQRDWLHAVPRDDAAGLRISLTFRRFRSPQ